jgi:hypothetical protein
MLSKDNALILDYQMPIGRHRDHAAAQMVLIRGVDNVLPVDDGEWKPPGNAVLSGALTLDKWLSRNAQQ